LNLIYDKPPSQNMTSRLCECELRWNGDLATGTGTDDAPHQGEDGKKGWRYQAGAIAVAQALPSKERVDRLAGHEYVEPGLSLDYFSIHLVSYLYWLNDVCVFWFVGGT
jgi:hypothetical protein